LRTLPSRSRHDHDTASASLIASRRSTDSDYRDDPHRRHHHRSDSSGSESSWTDTGDIGEHKGEGDPLRLQFSNDIEEELLAGVSSRHRKHKKKVRIQGPSPRRYGRSQSPGGLIDKEAIEIPHVIPRAPSRTSRCLGFIMAGRSGAANGLTGKALL
jgi:hypothetical protein